VVAATDRSSGGPEVQNDSSYLDGMQLGVQILNEGGGVEGRSVELRLHDDRGDTGRSTNEIGELLAARPTAILYVGPGPALAPLREGFALRGTPVVLLGGDLYTSRQLFPQAFQTTIPWEWQANVIARYLVKDRGAKRIDFIGVGPEARAAAGATRSALEYWGGRLRRAFVLPGSGSSSPQPSGGVVGADAVIEFGPSSDEHAAVAAVREIPGPPRSVGGAGLLQSHPSFGSPPPGTTACYTYTWAGWAEPIPRVGRFIDRFQAAFGHPPVGFEQEGYDAVQALGLALRRDGGGGGPRLTAAMETILDTAFSSFPIDLGPDDHLFLPRDELGLFAVPGPNEKLDPWQRPGADLWRPVMRTFTYDGKRDDILDPDKRVFFPTWRKNRPAPDYWSSRYGIVTSPKDRIH